MIMENEEYNKLYEDYMNIDKEWQEQSNKIEKYYDEFGNNLPEDITKLNKLSYERNMAQSKYLDAKFFTNDEKSQYQVMGNVAEVQNINEEIKGD